MANIKISDLTAASAAADANEFEINEAGTSKKVTGSQIKAYVNSGDGALAAKNTVATADIDNLAVTTAKLAADAVDGTKIADDAIDSEHIAADSIDAEHYAPNSVDATALNVTGNGTSGQSLTSDGDGSFSWADAGGGYAVTKITTFGNSQTWTKSPTTEYVTAIVVGAGGAGTIIGNLKPATALGGGGGGGFAIGTFSTSDTGNTAPVVIGSGGINPGFFDGNSNAVSGTPGGSSSFGSILSANGGSGASGGTGGSGGNGVVNTPGVGSGTGAGGSGSPGNTPNNTVGSGGAYGGRGLNGNTTYFPATNPIILNVWAGGGAGSNGLRGNTSTQGNQTRAQAGHVTVIEWSPT